MNRVELLKKANEWLEKAIRFEEDGKSKTMIDRCLSKAVELENEAFGS